MPYFSNLSGCSTGVLDELLQLALDALQAADVGPGDVGHLDHRLAQRRGVGHAQRRLEVVLRHRHGGQHLGVDRVVLQVDDVHLLADALQRGLGAQRRQVGAHVAVRVAPDRLQVHVLVQLHVLGVDAHDLQAAGLVGHADVDLAVEAAEAAQRGVDRVGPVGRAHHDHVRARLEAVHERQQLRHDAALHLALRLLALGRDGVDLVDEDDGRRVLLRLGKHLAQVGLRLARQLGHDLRAVDDDEEGAGLVGHRARDERLARAGRAVQQDALGRLHADGLEQLRVAQRQLHQLPDLRHLLAHAAHVVVAHLVQLLLVLPLDGLPLAEDLGVGRHDAVLRRLRLHHLELHGAHAAAREEGVALAHGPVRLQEVGLQVDVEQVAGDALDGVLEGQHVDARAVLDVRALVDGNDVAQANAQVLADDLVDTDLVLLGGLVGQHDADGVLALLALEQDGVAAEQLQLLHRRRVQRHHRVVVVHRLVHN